jgi:hypothetical protein
LQVAELCQLSFPDKPWMALVGLLQHVPAAHA